MVINAENQTKLTIASKFGEESEEEGPKRKSPELARDH